MSQTLSDGYSDIRAAMMSYYEYSTVQQLKPAPSRVELGIYDELEGEAKNAAESLSKQGDGPEKEEAPRESEASSIVKPTSKRQRQAAQVTPAVSEEARLIIPTEEVKGEAK